MINSVRNTVQSILNKNNYGYLSPSDFNLFAQQAQLDEFEGLFNDYNNYINKQNARTVGTGYADRLKAVAEEIDNFVVSVALVNLANNTWTLPADFYMLNKVLRNDATATYLNREMERVEHDKSTLLINSNLTPPTEDYAAYTLAGNVLTAYPATLDTAGDVVAVYVRYPLDPRWTFSSLTSGEPVFNQSQPDYQDFELSQSYETALVLRILELAGVSIREAAVVEFANREQMGVAQEKQ